MQVQFQTKKQPLETLAFYQINKQSQNKKPTIIFLHCGFGSKLTWQRSINQLLNQGCTSHIIALDLRGFGESTYYKPCNSYQDWARDIVIFCSSHGINKCFVVGWCLGGAIALKLAEIAPQIVQKLVLVSTLPHTSITMDVKFCRTRQQFLNEPLIQYRLRILKDLDYKAMAYDWKQITQQQKNDENYQLDIEPFIIRIIGCSFQMRCYVDYLTAVANSDIKIKSIHIKPQNVLIIHGDKDNFVPLEKLAQTRQRFPNIQIWKESSHFIPHQDNPKFIQQTFAFLQKQN